MWGDLEARGVAAPTCLLVIVVKPKHRDRAAQLGTWRCPCEYPIPLEKNSAAISAVQTKGGSAAISAVQTKGGRLSCTLVVAQRGWGVRRSFSTPVFLLY